MEFLWKDLKNEYESPNWHRDALLETEKRRYAGKEQVIGWNEAEKLLRKEL
ncbi:MAG: addiction module protein [Alcanivoracaceae bacterium]|nr:addiction module protein [Alcanivoracaceae bacterium]